MAIKEDSQAGVLIPGFRVALALKEGSAPLRCYVGEVQVVDEHGVRLTLVDSLTGMFNSWDFFVPWSSITAALVATPDHDIEKFGKAAEDFRKRCASMSTP
jgi:hypothetical protein